MQAATLREAGTLRAEKKLYPTSNAEQDYPENAFTAKSYLPARTEPKAPFVIEVFNCSQTQPEQEKNECFYVLKIHLFPVQTSEASSSCEKKKFSLLKRNHSSVTGTHSHHRHAILLHQSC